MFRPVTFLRSLVPGIALRRDPTIIYDTFGGAADTDMTGRTPDTISNGNTWVVSGADRFDIDGSGHAVNSWVQAWARIESNVSNCVVVTSMSVTWHNNGKMRLLVRYVDSDNYWAIEVEYSRFGQDYFRIIERNVAAETVRAEAAVTLADDAYYLVTATLNGAIITATLDSGNEISYASATFQQTATKHGMHCPDQAATWDSFKVVA